MNCLSFLLLTFSLVDDEDVNIDEEDDEEDEDAENEEEDDGDGEVGLKYLANDNIDVSLIAVMSNSN